MTDRMRALLSALADVHLGDTDLLGDLACEAKILLGEIECTHLSWETSLHPRQILCRAEKPVCVVPSYRDATCPDCRREARIVPL